MEPWLLVGIGGAIGSLLRYECSKIQPVRGLPAGTFIVNIAGSFLFGLLVFSRSPLDLIYCAGIGGMGGFTTFSTFSYETFRMLEDQDYYAMLANILINGTGSILGVIGALWICTMFTIPG
ncbi:MAG: CrcB family protein [Methanoregula sp.]|jgi:CrcB protein|nr:CrcB family protein [Methanoregula sp.]